MNNTVSKGLGQLGCSALTIALLAGFAAEARAQQGPFKIDMRLRSPAERRLTSWMRRGAEVGVQRRPLAPGPISYGLEQEPLLHFQMKRELLVFVANMTGESTFHNAARSLALSSSIREVVESRAIEWTRNRATFLQTEQMQGPAPLVTAPTTRAAFISTGGVLFGSALVAGRMLQFSPRGAFRVSPQPWPMGVWLSGRFASP